MNTDSFIQKWQGRGIDFDGYYGDQCMDLIRQYHVEVLGITDGRTLSAQSAKFVYTNFDNLHNHDRFTRIPHAQGVIPQKGDIVVFGNGEHGHIAIVVDADVSGFSSFDQNFPTGAKCQIVKHTYDGVLGYLRFKGGVDAYYKGLDLTNRESMMVAIDTWERVKNGELVDKMQFETQLNATNMCQSQLKTALEQVNSYNSQLAEYKVRCEDLQKKYETSEQSVIDLKNEIAKIHSQDSNFAQEALDAQHVAKDRGDYIKMIAEELDVKYDKEPDNKLVDEILREIAERQKQSHLTAIPEGSQLQSILKLFVAMGINGYLEKKGLPAIDPERVDPELEGKIRQYLNDLASELLGVNTSPAQTPVAETVKSPRRSFLSLLRPLIGLFIVQK